jgi:hypothetical protein
MLPLVEKTAILERSFNNHFGLKSTYETSRR